MIKHRMRLLKLTIVALLAISSCGQYNKNERTITVILFQNQNPALSLSVDTVMKELHFDLETTSFDLFFCHQHFHLPYYVPTDGIFRTRSKDKECDNRMYPATIKCYEYDSKNRVTKMNVNGSGTMNVFEYKYNNKDQVTEITNLGSVRYSLSYNSDGRISELKESDGIIAKRLLFIYN